MCHSLPTAWALMPFRAQQGEPNKFSKHAFVSPNKRTAINIVGLDTTGDGQVNAYDTNGDGRANARKLMGVDTTGDGRIDAIDLNGSAPAPSPPPPARAPHRRRRVGLSYSLPVAAGSSQPTLHA